MIGLDSQFGVLYDCLHSQLYKLLHGLESHIRNVLYCHFQYFTELQLFNESITNRV